MRLPPETSSQPSAFSGMFAAPLAAWPCRLARCKDAGGA